MLFPNKGIWSYLLNIENILSRKEKILNQPEIDHKGVTKSQKEREIKRKGMVKLQKWPEIDQEGVEKPEEEREIDHKGVVKRRKEVEIDQEGVVKPHEGLAKTKTQYPKPKKPKVFPARPD